jgi:Signal transduction histidine kinase
VVPPAGVESSEWGRIPILFWLLTTFPWFVFAIKYTGTRVQISRRTLAALGLPYLLIVIDVLGPLSNTGYASLFNVLGSIVFIYLLALAISGAYLLLESTYSYGHTTVWQGGSLAVVILGSLVIWNLIGLQADDAVGAAGFYTAGAAVAAVGVGAAWYRHDLFNSGPAIGTRGEQALTGETDDLMFVVDTDDRLITLNETAVRRLSVRRTDARGAPIHDLLGQGSKQLSQAETATVLTTEGTRQYDPQVSWVGDGHGNDIGATLSLRDITDRNLREQRLAVLNRVLRHNLRNQVDVLRGRAEALARSGVEVTGILDTADEIASLGQHARRIDQYVPESRETVAQETVDLTGTVRSVLDNLGADEMAVNVSVESATAATVTANRQALVGALNSALENALEHAQSAVVVEIDPDPDGYVIRVIDDGPGIPDWELESLDAGTESPLQHSTGLGLWQLSWAVTALNGDLSFDTANGTTVEIHIPGSGDES